MSFQYSAIGDNTPENREHLEKLGKKIVSGIVGNLIMTVEDKYMCIELDGEIGSNFNDAINCIGNDPLFRAVTAIREDTDEDQWFTNGKEWIFCDREDWIDMYSVLCSGGRYNYNKNGELDKFFKATLAELQEYFKLV